MGKMSRTLGSALTAGGAVLALIVGGLYLPDWDADTPPVRLDAPPTRQDVVRQVGVGPAQPEDGRALRFARMLTQRYRGQGFAVRVLMRPDGTIELRCGANMTRRQMAVVAAQVRGDAAAVFGRPAELVLFETYAAGPQRKVAEIKLAGAAGRPVLRFLEPSR